MKKKIKMNEKNSQMTAKDIIQSMIDLDGIVIAPFNKDRAKGVGYNISMTRLVYSLSKNRLVPIITSGDEVYFYIHPNETILGLSYEYLKVNNSIAGIFQSRVRTTAKGLSGTSTTLDPGWNGMLQLTLNNPTSKKIKVVIEKIFPDGNWYPCPFITMIVWRVSGIEKKKIEFQVDNPPMHLDIWNNFVLKDNNIFFRNNKKKFYKIINYLSDLDNIHNSTDNWIKEIITYINNIRTSKNDIDIIEDNLTRMKNYYDELPQYVDIRIQFSEAIFHFKKNFKKIKMII